MKRALLIDGHNLLFRMFYGIPSSIKNSKGIEIRGLIGFIGSLKKLINELNPDYLFVAFDSETSKNSNLELDSTYKQNRIDYTSVPDDDNPFAELPMIKRALEYLNINYLEIENYEADDLIAAIVKKSEYEFIIVSTDTDFIQLVNSHTFLYVPRGKKSILYTEEIVENKLSVKSSKYVLYKSLVGDKSDNIKGIKGIGPKTAGNILKFGSLEEFMDKNPTSKQTLMLKENMSLIEKNIKLIEMNSSLDTSNISLSSVSDAIKTESTYEIIEKIGER